MKQLRRREIFDLVDDVPVASNYAAFSYIEVLDRRLEIIIGNTDHIEGLVRFSDHLLALKHPLNCA